MKAADRAREMLGWGVNPEDGHTPSGIVIYHELRRWNQKVKAEQAEQAFRAEVERRRKQ